MKKINLKVVLKRLFSPLVKLINLIILPFKKIYHFFTAAEREPLDFSKITDFSAPNQPLWDKVEDLRRVLFRVALSILLCSLVAFYYSPSIFKFIQMPLAAITEDGLSVSSPGEVLDLVPRVSIAVGFYFALPLIMYEIFLFFAPSMKPKGRISFLLLLLGGILLLIIGITTDYFYILPATLRGTYNLTKQYGLYDWELVKYIYFVLKVYFATEIAIFIPLLIAYLNRVGKLESSILKSPSIIFFILFFLAAAITPGTALVLDFGFSLFMFLIYLLTNMFFNLFYQKKVTEKTIK